MTTPEQTAQVPPNPHLERACWLIINEHETRYGARPTGLYFNKALSLLHRQLKEDGHNLKLPHCWYRFGDEVVRFAIPSQVAWDHDVKTSVGWRGSEPARPDDELGEAMAARLDEVLKDFSAQEHIEDMVDKVYDYAPFEFQRSYRQIRRAGFDSQQSVLPPRAVSNILDGLIENAHRDFPKKHFPLASYYADCAFQAASLTLEADDSKSEFVRESLEKFWEYWCYHLRLHRDAHENVPEQTISVWEEELEPQERKYAIVFRSHLREMIGVQPAIEDMEIFSPWLAALRRSEGAFSSKADRWAAVFKGIDEFVQSEKSGYAK